VFIDQPLTTRAIVGVFNLGEIVHGQFQSAYVGYYAFAPHADGELELVKE